MLAVILTVVIIIAMAVIMSKLKFGGVLKQHTFIVSAFLWV